MISDFSHLLKSYHLAKIGHTKKGPILRFSFYLERELIQLSHEIDKKSYKPKPKKPFLVFEPKQRKIFESHFRDRVVHHAVCSIINPNFEKRSLPVSYACRKGFGNLKALNKVSRTIRAIEDSGKKPWILKVDIKKYFDNIDQNKLRRLIRRDSTDVNLLRIVDIIIDSYEAQPGRGLPIGNLTSQIFANLYLNEMDYFIVHKKGFKKVFRFMDDILIVHHNSEDLKLLLEEIKKFAVDNLKLEIHPNKIFLRPVAQSFEFLGFRIDINKRSIKPANMARIKNRLRRLSKALKNKKTGPEKMKQRLQSWMGYACHGQVKNQLFHLADWSSTLGCEEFQKILRDVFVPPSVKQLPALTPPQSTAKIVHSVSYQSPLDRELVESKSEFSQALQWHQ